MRAHFWQTRHLEGAGLFWAWDGVPVARFDLTKCALCQREDADCDSVAIDKKYHDSIWYLGFANLTRYKAENKAYKGRRNVVAFIKDTAVIHIGRTKRKNQAFLIFDRKFIHRFLLNLHAATPCTLVNILRPVWI